MLWLQDVPQFTWILIHTLNDSTQTSGCLGVGSAQQDLDLDAKGLITQSRDAYMRLYPKVRDALLAGDKVTIKYSKINLDEKQLSNKATEDVVLTNVIDDKFDKIMKELKNLRSAVFTVKNIT